MSWGFPRETRRIEGAVIPNLRELVAHLDAGGWVYFNRRAYHPKVILNWSIGRLMYLSQKGALLRADINPKRARAEDSGEVQRRVSADDRLARERFQLALGSRIGP
jgi:hypothetical protein